MLLSNVITSTVDTPLSGRLRTGGASGSTASTSDYVTMLDHVFESGSGQSNNHHNHIDQSEWRFQTNGTNGSNRAMSANIFLSGVGSTTSYPLFTCDSVGQTSSQFDIFNGGGRYEVASTNFTGITFFPASGNFTAGKFNIYGYKK